MMHGSYVRKEELFIPDAKEKFSLLPLAFSYSCVTASIASYRQQMLRMGTHKGS